MDKRILSMAAALVMLTGCSGLPGNDGGKTEVTTAPVTTAQETTAPPTTLPQKMIYFRMGEDENTEPFLTSEHITDCAMEVLPSDSGESTYVVNIFLDDEGKEIFAEKTAEAAANGSTISTWYNQYVISVATVEEPITDGAAVISGLDMRGASKIAGWIYECIKKPEETTANEGEQQ